MANRSDREPGQPVRMSWASLPAKQSGTRLADTIKASGQHERLHQQAGQKTAPDPIVKNVKSPLAPREPSTEDIAGDHTGGRGCARSCHVGKVRSRQVAGKVLARDLSEMRVLTRRRQRSRPVFPRLKQQAPFRCLPRHARRRQRVRKRVRYAISIGKNSGATRLTSAINRRASSLWPSWA